MLVSQVNSIEAAVKWLSEHTHTLHAFLSFISVQFLELRIMQQKRIELMLVDLRSVL